MRFEDKVAIVTGAAGGIGSATVLLLAQEGARVAALDLDKTGLDKLVEDSGDFSGPITPFVADAFDPDEVQRTVQAVIDWTGHVDILINCVGGSTVIANSGRPVEELEPEEWKRVLDFNLDSTFLFCRAVLPLMKQQRSGKIVNLSSRSATGLGSTPSAYAAAKAGIVAFTTRVANEAGPFGINVNAVAPDTTLTRRIVEKIWDIKSPEEQNAYLETVALRRLGQPEDQAKVIAFLASNDADFISGQTIHVNGGM